MYPFHVIVEAGHECEPEAETVGEPTPVKVSHQDVNVAIEKTMKSLAELDVSDVTSHNDVNSATSCDSGGVPPSSAEDVENRTNADIQRVNTFHDYCAASSSVENAENTVPNSDLVTEGSKGAENMQDGGLEEVADDAVNYDDQWKALWDEHYQEMYWFYYSKYQQFIPTEEGWVPRDEQVEGDGQNVIVTPEQLTESDTVCNVQDTLNIKQNENMEGKDPVNVDVVDQCTAGFSASDNCTKWDTKRTEEDNDVNMKNDGSENAHVGSDSINTDTLSYDCADDAQEPSDGSGGGGKKRSRGNKFKQAGKTKFN